MPECWEDHDQRGKSLKRKSIIKLSHTQEVIKLFDSISQDANLPDTYYEMSRYISSPEYDEMNLYEISFEPYLSIAKQCGMNFLPCIGANNEYILFIVTMPVIPHLDGKRILSNYLNLRILS